ncbi:hypothetical protein SAMN02927900_04596 [Rhizobium mongolense subsp. loessense]|uniref:Uncharacterized protein n=1 Tax=Rhizobium mongolense subsp. loessense TaxID=158890 RepID=A0A1G4T686_9HYPH|nr:hypothetical protein SAMN02927900_04596 [Rhizobium mongolense subsp. loessense]
MASQQIICEVLFFFSLFGLLFGTWKYLDSNLTAGRKETEKVAEVPAAHKLPTAEHYVAKRDFEKPPMKSWTRCGSAK